MATLSTVTIIGIFTNGGGSEKTPTELMNEAFAKQAKMLKEQFKELRKNLELKLDEVQLQNMETKALSLLDALSSKQEFISAYDGLETCLSDEVAAEITERVGYFTEQVEVFNVRHVFDEKCPKLAETAKANMNNEEQVQLKLCATLLYTEMVIELKKRYILGRMMVLLSKSKKHYQVTDGYLKVDLNERRTLKAWLESSVLFKDPMDSKSVPKVYCGLFYHNMKSWDFDLTDEGPRRYTLELLHMFADMDKDIRINCFDDGKGAFSRHKSNF